MIAKPRDYEEHRLLDFLKRESVPSKIVPAINRTAFVLHCPGCKTRIGEMPVTFDHACDCGLHLQGDILKLTIWREPATSEV